MDDLRSSTSIIAVLAGTVPAGTSTDDEFLQERDAAAFLGVSPRSMQRWRSDGTGPAYVRLGHRRVTYRKSGLIAWTNNRTFRSVSEEGACYAAA
jgi:predicted DNA-binding transcriptional regulator AlpA